VNKPDEANDDQGFHRKPNERVRDATVVLECRYRSADGPECVDVGSFGCERHRQGRVRSFPIEARSRKARSGKKVGDWFHRCSEYPVDCGGGWVLPTTEAEIDAFVTAFEAGTLPKAQWTHGAHLLTGACYVHGLGEAAATEKMRTCVRRYNEAVGGKNTETSGYHETITVLWIKLLGKLLRESQPIARADFAQLAVSDS
jgi:hypothetical protein